MPPAGPEAWDRGLEPLQRALAQSSRCWLLSHPIVGRSPDDAILISQYLRRVWAPVAKLPGHGTFMLAFGVVRAVPSGVPLVSHAWYIGRRERDACQQIVRVFDADLTFEY